MARSRTPTQRPSFRSRSWRVGGSVVAASSRGRREIPADDFFLGPFTTSLEPDELVVETHLAGSRAGDGFAFEELAQRGGRLRARDGRGSRSGAASCAWRSGSVVDRPTARSRSTRSIPGESAARAGRAVGHRSTRSPGVPAAARTRPRRSRRRPGEGDGGGVIAVDVTVNGTAVPRGGRAAATPLRLPPRHSWGSRGRTSAASTASAARAPCSSTASRCAPACCSPSQVDGAEIVTVEGLARDGALTPLQEAFRAPPRAPVRLLYARES